MYSFANILHFLFIIQTLFFGVQLLAFKKSKSVPNNIMGVLMLTVSLYYLANATFLFPNEELIRISKYLVYFLFLGVNPFYYIYTQSVTIEKYKFKKKYLVHFLPSVFLFIGIIISSSSLLNIEQIRLMAVVMYNMQVLIYTVLMFLLLNKHKRNIKNFYSYSSSRINLSWLRIFIIVYVIFTALDLVVFYVHSFTEWEIFYFVLIILFFNFLGFFSIKQSDIYKNNTKQADNNSNEDIDLEIESEKKTLLSDEKAQDLMIDIIALIEGKELFKKADLTIFDVAKQLDINKTYISYVINELLSENFSSFINRYRIESAKKMLLDDNFNHLTIEGIGNVVGFNSKSSFNSSFKKHTGVTPSSFKKSSLS